MSEYKLNRNFMLRDAMLEDFFTGSSGGITRFQNVDVNTLLTLLDLNFADPEDAQNNSPTYKEFVDFMVAHPQVRAHGYVVDIRRPDYRITIEGLECDGVMSKELITDFVDFCEGCDDLTVNDDRLYSWWD